MILWLRKSLRLIGLLFPAAALLLGRGWGIAAVIFFLALMGGIEAARFRDPRVNEWLFRRMGSVFKEKERRRPSGITFFLVASLFCLAVFPVGPASAAIAFQAVGDALAEIAGSRRGRVRLHGPKTLEGSLACFGGCLAISPLLALPWSAVWGLGSFAAVLPVLCAGAAAATLTELAVVRWDDNLFMPPAAALVMWLLLRFA